MDPEFERRLRAGEPPFNGFTLCSQGVLARPALRQAVAAMVAVLEAWGPRGALYWVLNGYDRDALEEPALTSWDQVKGLLAPSRPPSAPGVFPADRSFLLRFQVPEDAVTPGRWGMVDLTGPKHLLEMAADSAAEAGVDCLAVEVAKVFFERGVAEDIEKPRP
jgi:hypothetical protein